MPPFADVERTLRLEKQPLAPTYMAYIYQQPEPSAAEASRRRAPSQPSSNTNWNATLLNDAKSVYEHFHRPCNEHNKYLATVRDDDKYAYRDLPRMAPPPFDKSGRSSIRPSSASPRPDTTRRTTSPRPTSAPGTQHLDTTALMERTVTQTGAPCFNTTALIAADLEACTPLPDPGAVGENTWRRARVLTYEVPPSSVGYGEGGKRPFHQDYSHYKYYGFAGKGAKSSWGYNPRCAETWRATKPARATGTVSTARQPGQPLSAAEAKLVLKYGDHNLQSSKQPQVEIIEPYTEHVHIIHRTPLTQRQRADKSIKRDKAQVVTYHQPVPGDLTMSENPSPNHGSQAPFHQRYNHYRMYGFAGCGATSSWARNPKMAMLYD